jgi:arabinose-5-phosphate isomerase
MVLHMTDKPIFFKPNGFISKQLFMNVDIISIAKKTIQLQAIEIENIGNFIDANFVEAVTTINNCKSRVVVSGIGKSGIIAQKIVSTLNSTGTPSLFLHAADAIHGDLGMVQKNDIVIIISKSGDSPEIKVLLPLIKNFGNTIIAITGNLQGYLAHNANIVLNTTVVQEACPNNLAPTTSTTAQMVMGDALAVSLMELKGFNTKDFAKYHPGGNLGKRLYLTVANVYKKEQVPSVKTSATLKEIIVEITSKRLGATAVVNEKNEIEGMITDGDLRRMLEHNNFLSTVLAKDILTSNPKKIEASALAIEALEKMRTHNISQLIVTNSGQYLGIIHIHDLMNEGIV